MSDSCFFIGPYVECRSLQDVWPQDRDLRTAWDGLLNDRKRLEWNMPFGNARIMHVDDVELYQYCGVPVEQRAAPRWPMFFKFEGLLHDSQSFDWTTTDPGAELEWFKKAYDEELALLDKIFNARPALRWGLVYWPQ